MHRSAFKYIEIIWAPVDGAQGGSYFVCLRISVICSVSDMGGSIVSLPVEVEG